MSKKKKTKFYSIPLEQMQELWKLGHKVVESKKKYSRKKKHKKREEQ